MPQSISEIFTGPGFGIYKLQLNPWFCDCAEWSRVPVCLRRLLPHDAVEFRIVLETKDEPCIVIIYLGVNKECSTEVDSRESGITCRRKRSMLYNAKEHMIV